MGELKDYQFHGQGTLTDKDGTKHEVEWKDGEIKLLDIVDEKAVTQKILVSPATKPLNKLKPLHAKPPQRGDDSIDMSDIEFELIDTSQEAVEPEPSAQKPRSTITEQQLVINQPNNQRTSLSRH